MALFEHLYRDENPTGACARLALTEVKQKFLFHSAIAVEAFFKFGNVARSPFLELGACHANRNSLVSTQICVQWSRNSALLGPPSKIWSRQKNSTIAVKFLVKCFSKYFCCGS